MSREDSETKRVRTSDINKTARISSSKNNKKNKNSKSKNKKTKFKYKHPKAARAIKIGFVVLVLLVIIGLGMLVGAFVGIFGEELKIDETSLVVGFENSTVYDSDGTYLATLSGGTKRQSVSLSEMSEYLPKAYVAIEDERFYEHSGIDLGRTGYATLTYLLHGGKSSFGGSTITQQVIKNITQEKDNTALAGVMRKVKEISKAIQVEHYLSKDQILELYLNLIFVGGDDINGVQLGSVYYFNKSAKDLSIAECAYLAGINNSPNAYKPFATYEGEEDAQAKLEKMKDKINKRTKTVLSKMKEVNYINDDQYNEAVAEVDNGLHFEKGEAASVTTEVSYLTEAAIEEILDQMMAEDSDMNRSMAEMKLYSSGYKIYTTQKTSIQNTLEEEIVKDKYYTKSKGNSPQDSMPTMVIVDHTNGHVVAAATATGDKDSRTAITRLGYYNFPTKIKKQTGSSMKPLAVIAPGLESGMITGATVFDDCPTSWGTWSPKDYDRYRGLINMRTAIEVSANIPHAKALAVIGTDKAVEFCSSIGFPKFEEEGLSLALGGLRDGVSPTQMAAAYSAIANDGTYNSPIFYTKVTDSSDNVIYEPVQESNRVMTEQNAYIEKDILKQPVLTGTATYCAIPGMDVSAKTGTTNDDNDRWLCGFTPYYTAACWYGYKDNSQVFYSGNPAGKIWSAVMKSIHTDLPNAKYEEPDGIIRQAVCKVSGLLPGPGCSAYTELFTADNLPKETCPGHSAIRICNDSKLLATGACPNVTETYGFLPQYEVDASWESQHTAVANPEGYCTIHAGGGASFVTAVDQAGFQAATDAAANGLTGDQAQAYINTVKAAVGNGQPAPTVQQFLQGVQPSAPQASTPLPSATPATQNTGNDGTLSNGTAAESNSQENQT